MDEREVKQVLLIDDNPADLDLITDILGGSRLYRITKAQDGDEALTVLSSAKNNKASSLPDLVVLDLNLPRKDGRTVLAQLKSDPILKRIPVLVFTTSQAHHDIERAYELGANCYVSKPGNLKDFIAAVKSLENFWFTSAHLPQRVAP